MDCHSSPGHLPNPGIEPTSLASPALAGGFFTASTTWEALNLPHDPEIPLLSIYLEKTTILKDTCTPTVNCSTIYGSQDMEAISKSICRWMDKEDVVLIYNRILISPKRELIWVSSREVDEPKPVMQSEVRKQKQISHIKAYICNLENWYWTCLQGRNGDTDVENRLVETAGEGESETNEESSIDIYVLSCVK